MERIAYFHTTSAASALTFDEGYQSDFQRHSVGDNVMGEEQKFYWLNIGTNIVMMTIGREYPGKGWVEIDRDEYYRRIDEQNKADKNSSQEK